MKVEYFFIKLKTTFLERMSVNFLLYTLQGGSKYSNEFKMITNRRRLKSKRGFDGGGYYAKLIVF